MGESLGGDHRTLQGELCFIAAQRSRACLEKLKQIVGFETEKCFMMHVQNSSLMDLCWVFVSFMLFGGV